MTRSSKGWAGAGIKWSARSSKDRTLVRSLLCGGCLVPLQFSRDRVLPHTQAPVDRCVVAAPSQ